MLEWITKQGKLFALAIFISDNFLKFQEIGSREFQREAAGNEVNKIESIRRFFNIAAQLPMELQMLLVHRIQGSNLDYIPLYEREEAFKELADFME